MANLWPCTLAEPPVQPLHHEIRLTQAHRYHLVVETRPGRDRAPDGGDRVVLGAARLASELDPHVTAWMDPVHAAGPHTVDDHGVLQPAQALRVFDQRRCGIDAASRGHCVAEPGEDSGW
jgi:hypothetical protein